MKQLIMLLMAAALFTSCKKDGKGLTITTTVEDKVGAQSGVRVKVYAGTDTMASSLVKEGVSSSTGSFEFEDYNAGTYTVSASYTDDNVVPNKVYGALQNIVLQSKVDYDLALELSCNNCCAGITCVNGNSVQVGSNCYCNCEAGYEGAACDTLVRNRFLGTHSGNENCSMSTYVYSITITAGSTDEAIVIDNIYDLGLTANGRFTSTGSFTISSQTFGTGTISGSGNMDAAGKVRIYYTISVTGNSDSCTFQEN